MLITRVTLLCGGTGPALAVVPKVLLLQYQWNGQTVLFARTWTIVIALPPGHEAVMFTVLPPLTIPYGLPSCTCSPLPMNEKVRAPIHAATAMLTATVTAIRIIEATTGLRAFLLLKISILFSSLPLGPYSMGKAVFNSYDLLHHRPRTYNKRSARAKPVREVKSLLLM